MQPTPTSPVMSFVEKTGAKRRSVYPLALVIGKKQRSNNVIGTMLVFLKKKITGSGFKNLKTPDFISQAWMVIFGCAAIWLLGRREQWRRWGYVAGLISQPAWLFTGLYHHQWGLVLVSLWYTYSWVQGIWNFWIKAR